MTLSVPARSLGYACLLSGVRDRWAALRGDAHDLLTAETPAGREAFIIGGYSSSWI